MTIKKMDRKNDGPVFLRMYLEPDGEVVLISRIISKGYKWLKCGEIFA
jgi:hypothetical protein